MALPRSFGDFKVPARSRFRGCMIGVEGGANTGKTELSWSAPGPGISLSLDRGHRSAIESANPPSTRALVADENLLIIPIAAPLNTGVTQQQAQSSWRDFYGTQYLPSLQNADARTVILDGDTDSFEWQMLAEFGRTNMIPQIQRTALNAARRVMITRAVDSGKVFIATYKLKKKYENVLDANGDPVPDPEKPGQTKRDWDGKSYERQGFNDYEYGYELQLRTLYRRASLIETGKRAGEMRPASWGVQILMCKANRKLEGDELWGDDCNLPTLLQYVYPHIDLKEWGYV